MGILKEYELYVPLISTSNERYPAKKLKSLKSELVKRFGGLTHFPQKNKGLWKIGEVTFHDEIVILRVLTPETIAVRRFWVGLKRRLEKELNQEQVLIIARKVETVFQQ